ncbi:MAG TPA: zinc-binding dehydrogenase [Baekduia sp.]|uniref:zinc-binding dehydrogenase n=1 Tax=Baekduia sp. TaxID=2600305 RepID=UPI002D7A2CF1|nr:zinc-binding dehydrogenase [Baekduia sp.]HET6507896.1 zinc-binding dehydrogenase [Baekduia sp.]
MNAAALAAFGGPEALAFGERPDPVAPPGWAVVELRAAALNWHDVLVRRGQYDVALPRVPGADGAGVRRDTDEAVVILPSLHWGEDDRFPSPAFEILGDHTDGTYAELVAVPEVNLMALPSGWSWEEAAALPLAGLTAYRALFTRGGLRAGETVLVLGAGSGVSTMAIALAALAGARVLVTSSSRAKIEAARELGADGGALYTRDGWPEEIRALTPGGRGVDLVIDSAGTWPQALAALAGGGRLVNFGATATPDATVELRRFYFGQHTILGTTMGSPRDFAGLLALLAEHPTWRPLVHATYPLDRAADAHAALERREHIGKLVLSV